MHRIAALVTLLILLALALGHISGGATTQAVECTTENYWDAAADAPAWSWQECEVGTTIEVTNEEWHCTKALSEYGELPLKIVSRWTAPNPSGSNIAVSADGGCKNPPGIDLNLIVDVQGEGAGQVSDAFKTRVDPTNVRMTGNLDCGARLAGDHQDGIQLQGGDEISFVNMDVGGDYAAGEANCQGAGGAIFWSMRQTVAHVLGGTYIGCNHSFDAHSGNVGAGSSVVNAKFRSGRNSGNGGPPGLCEQVDGTPFHTSQPCVAQGVANMQAAGTWSGNSCQRWTNGAWVEQGSPSPPPPPTPPPPSPPPPSPPPPSPPPPSPPPTPAPTLTVCEQAPHTFVACWPALTGVTGYAFYRDGTRVSTSSNGALTRVRFGWLSGTHSYGVEAVYGSGERRLSELVLTH